MNFHSSSECDFFLRVVHSAATSSFSSSYVEANRLLSFGSQTTSRWCRNGSCTWNSSRKLFLTIHLFIARTSRAIESERNFSSDIVEHLKMLRGFFHSTAHTHFHQVAVITCRNAWNWQKIRIRIQWKVCCFLRISLSKRKSQRDDKERENSEQST